MTSRHAGCVIGLAALGLAALARPAAAEYVVSLQGAAVLTARNDAAVPGDAGTRFSLADELDPGTSWAWRLEAGHYFKRDYLGVTVAPYAAASRGTPGREIRFAGERFAAGEPLEGTFRFDSYRLTWRHRVLARGRVEGWLGLTAKIRDAEIALEGGGRSARKENTGFVPLVSFALDWRFAPPLGLLVQGDALAAPQGRAEDVLAVLTVDLPARSRLFLGYRILEGGADSDEVYTFSLLHYAVLGTEWRF